MFLPHAVVKIAGLIAVDVQIRDQCPRIASDHGRAMLAVVISLAKDIMNDPTWSRDWRLPLVGYMGDIRREIYNVLGRRVHID